MVMLSWYLQWHERLVYAEVCIYMKPAFFEDLGLTMKVNSIPRPLHSHRTGSIMKLFSIRHGAMLHFQAA